MSNTITLARKNLKEFGYYECSIQGIQYLFELDMNTCYVFDKQSDECVFECTSFADLIDWIIDQYE